MLQVVKGTVYTVSFFLYLRHCFSSRLTTFKVALVCIWAPRHGYALKYHFCIFVPTRDQYSFKKEFHNTIDMVHSDMLNSDLP